MNTPQLVFYILGSIAFGLFSIYLIVAFVVLMAIRRRAARVNRRMHLMIDEAHSLIQAGKSYTKYISASMISSVLKLIIKILT